MNGSLYISFFQGQLESALEQVVQFAVTEITGTVGASLSSMLLETARKEQENQRLRGTIQSPRHGERERGERADTESQHAALRLGVYTDSLRLEQKRRAVGQLKVVMERVLEFAVCELSKIVEDSFDDVLLELRKVEYVNEELMAKLRGVAENGAGDPEKKESQGNRVESQTSTDVVKDVEKPNAEEQGMEQTQNADDSTLPPAAVSVSQDWVPVLDQVFGQKWCADIWPVKETGNIKVEQPHLPSEEPIGEDSAPHGNDDSQSERPQWLQDAEALKVNFDSQQTSEMSSTGDDVQLKSPSMLHRLLTLPSQLLEGDEESMESEEALLNTIASLHGAQMPHHDTVKVEDCNGGDDPEGREGGKEEEEEEEQGEEAKPRAYRSRRKNHACATCGKKFSRAHLLKAHRLTHKEARSPFSKLHSHT